MPTLSETVARFPLVPRPRPACLPLPQRVRGLTVIAQTAAATKNPVTASAVYNQAALLASDVGLPEFASELCHRHAGAYMHAAPLTAETAIRALEPVVNLARLQLRAQHGDVGLDLLLHLSQAIASSTALRFADVLVPAGLIQDATARQEVCAWLWRVLLADGSRALTGAGRWNDALTHVQEHQGIGARMLDGRQIAVVAALTNGETATAAELIAETKPSDPWELAVTACLQALCRRASCDLDGGQENELEAAVLAVPIDPGMNVFNIRLHLTALDTIGSITSPAASRITEQLHGKAVAARDGFAARELLADPLFTELATPTQLKDCRELVDLCALGAGSIPAQLHSDLDDALHLSDGVIRDSFPSS